MTDPIYRSTVPKWMQERVVQEYEERSRMLAVNMIPVEMKKHGEDVCGEDVKKDVEGDREDDPKEDPEEVKEGGCCSVKPTKAWLRRQRKKKLESTSSKQLGC